MIELADSWQGALQGISAFLEAGGGVLWAILALSLLLWTLVIERYWFFRRVFPQRVHGWVKAWCKRPDRTSWRAHRIREGVVAEARRQLGLTLPHIRTLVALCPLFGLLGTVTGMIEVFDVMAVTGTGNPRAMASGVARATLPTMAGMVVAIAGLYFSTRLQHASRLRLQHLRDELGVVDGASSDAAA